MYLHGRPAAIRSRHPGRERLASWRRRAPTNFSFPRNPVNCASTDARLPQRAASNRSRIRSAPKALHDTARTVAVVSSKAP